MDKIASKKFISAAHFSIPGGHLLGSYLQKQKNHPE